jgi:adenylate kinase
MDERARSVPCLVVIFLGPPGAGKGTQASKLAAQCAVPHLSTGDMFRENISADTPLGGLARPIMDRGELVPDELVLAMVTERLRRHDCQHGCVFDGFPRTVPQADALGKILEDGGLGKPVVVNFVVDRAQVLRRISFRRMCPLCGAIYHLQDRAPRGDGICDNDGTALAQRQDDREEVVAKRLDAFYRQTQPLVDYYRARGLLWEVDASGDVESVTQAVRGAIAQAKSQRGVSKWPAPPANAWHDGL